MTSDPNIMNAGNAKPDGSGKRRVRDVVWVILAAAIIGTVCKSSAVFVVVAVIVVIMYCVSGPPNATKRR